MYLVNIKRIIGNLYFTGGIILVTNRIKKIKPIKRNSKEALNAGPIRNLKGSRS